MHVYPAVIRSRQQRFQRPGVFPVDPGKPVVVQAIVGVYPFENSREPAAKNHAVKCAVFGLILAKLQFRPRRFVTDFEPVFPRAARLPLHAAAPRQFVEVVQQCAVQGDPLQLFRPAVVLFLVVLFLQNRLADQIIPLPIRLPEGVRREVQTALASQGELSFGLHCFHEALGISKDIELLVRADAKTQRQSVVCVFDSRVQPNRTARYPNLFGFVRNGGGHRSVPVSAPEAVQQSSGLLVSRIPVAFPLQFLNGFQQQSETMLADLCVLSAHIVGIITPAPIYRAVHADHPVPGDGDSHRVKAAALEIARCHQHLPAASAIRAVAVLHLDIMQGSVFQQLLCFPIGIGVDLDVSGEALRHIIAVFSGICRLGKWIDFYMSRHAGTCLFLASYTWDLQRRNFIQGRRHVLAAVSVLGIGAFTAHEVKPVTLNPDLHLILFCTLYGGIIQVPVLDQGAHLILFVILPSALKDRS